MDSTPLSLLMNAYYQAMTFGYGRTVTEALALLNYLVTIELILMGLWWTISEENYTAVALSKVFTVSVVVWLLTGWPDLMDVFQRTFIEGGLRASGSVLTVSDFRNPSNIFSFGAQVHAVLMGQLAQRSAWNALRHLPQILMSTTTALFILLAYAIMAIQIAVAMLEFYLIATVTVFLLPFSVFKPLAFLAEKAIGAVIANGVRLFILSYITGVAQPVFTRLTMPVDPTMDQATAFALAVGFQLILAWKGPSLANALLAGAVSLTGQDALRTAIATGAQAGAMATGAGHAVGAGIRAGQGVAGAVQAGRAGAASFGATHMTPSHYPAGMAGAAMGVGQYTAAQAGAMATNTLRHFTHPGSSRGLARAGHMIP